MSAIVFCLRPTRFVPGVLLPGALLPGVLAAWLGSPCAWRPAEAATLTLPLDPPHAQIAFRAYAMGLFPLDGAFTHFNGVLVVDPARLSACHVTLRIEVESLQLQNTDLRRDVLSPALLDSARFPLLEYQGACAADTAIAGELAMHGERHPLVFDVLPRGAGLYEAEAVVDRTVWGVRGMPVRAGRSIRITVSTRLPSPSRMDTQR